MPHQFRKHYSPDEARALLPQIREWLPALATCRKELEMLDRRVAGLLLPGCDLGGSLCNSWVRKTMEVQRLLMNFIRLEVQIKDLDRGLIDFPALQGDREVFLCWELGEDDIEFWHDLDSGYSGRERL
jgi:hypothetical protein